MAPICASFGFRSRVQSSEGVGVKQVFWWSYSREVLWKTKFTFAAKSSSQARWHWREKAPSLATGFLGHGRGAAAPTGTWAVLPFGHGNRSCAGPGTLRLEGWRWSLGFGRPCKNRQSGMKVKLTKVAEVYFPSNVPMAPSLLWAGWDFGTVRGV